jgi:hypothetical protein
LHLEQDILVKYKLDGNGDAVRLPQVIPDFSNADLGDERYHYYGWWFYDNPGAVEHTPNPTPATANPPVYDLNLTAYFWEAHVFVEEDPAVQMYWGFWVRANFDAKGADIDALVGSLNFGPFKSEAPIPPFIHAGG